MAENIIELDFNKFTCRAELFDTRIAKNFAEHLPYEVALTQWGEELYGSIDVNLGEENPVEDIPEGGIAYSAQGSYVCIFFGQTPAWPVEYIGDIIGNDWEKLLDNLPLESVTIRAVLSE